MQGDFSRNTFNHLHHFSRVLLQQGRVQVDADWNEQVSILLHYLRALSTDLIGPFGGPGFAVDKIPTTGTLQDLAISLGHYYVDGVLCENEQRFDEMGQPTPTSYYYQPNFQPDKTKTDEMLPTDVSFLVYLDVWERHVTYLETTCAPFTLNTSNIREVALNGPDTATRAKVIWQVKVQKLTDDTGVSAVLEEENWTPKVKTEYIKSHFSQWVPGWQSDDAKLLKRGKLKAMAKEDATQSKDPCVAPPQANYRRLENQLYRVEIHRPGQAWNHGKDNKGNNTTDNQTSAATFKWSRDNGSHIFPVSSIHEDTVTLGHLGHDDASTLHENDWVEIVDDDILPPGQYRPLAQVFFVNRDDLTVTLKFPTAARPPAYQAEQYNKKHVLLRRWDHTISSAAADKAEPTASEGALLVSEGEEVWLPLEDGVQICFQPAPQPTPPSTTPASHVYRSGDYWLIPARVATQDVEWPRGMDQKPIAQCPHGVDHHYAPLAIIVKTTENTFAVRHPWRN